MKWPRTIPDDLRRRLEATLLHRSINAATIWGDVFEWLEKHEVQPPGHRLPVAEQLPTKTGH